MLLKLEHFCLFGESCLNLPSLNNLQFPCHIILAGFSIYTVLEDVSS